MTRLHLVLISLFILWSIYIYLNSKARKHHWNIWLAGRKLKKLNNIIEPWDKFRFLRKINPYVFEEMVLTSLNRRGHKIKRGKSYSGDGGIDGQVQMNGECYLIQSKRYSNHIKASHVKDFARICQRNSKKGLFVHTGRTGKKSKVMAGYGDIQFISGRGLLVMLNAGR